MNRKDISVQLTVEKNAEVTLSIIIFESCDH